MKLTSYFVLVIVYFEKGFYCQIDNTTMVTFTNATMMNDVSIINTTVNNTKILPIDTIQFLLYTRDNPDVGIAIQDNLSLIQQNRSVKFLIHGFLESELTVWYKNLTRTLLLKGDFSVFQVGWGLLAIPPYTLASQNTKIVGDRVGEFIVKIQSQRGISFDDFHVIGHSLGSHVAGFAGKKVFELTGNKIRIITSLDAAGPLFEVPPKPPSERLYYKDATIVENLHSDGGVFGFKEPVGTIDYFANAGVRTQPGCGLKDIQFSLEAPPLQISCSHQKSHEFYNQAVMKNGISTLQCDSYTAFKAGNCAYNEVAILGLLDGNVNRTGTFYFQIS